MKNEVLDILILGLLVVLFASIYRKRATSRLRCWVIAWILVWRISPRFSRCPHQETLVDSLSIEHLAAFRVVLSCSPLQLSFEAPLGRALVAFGIGIPGAVLSQLRDLRRVAAVAVLLAATAVAVAGTVLAWKLCRERSRVWAVITLAFSGGWRLVRDRHRPRTARPRHPGLAV